MRRAARTAASLSMCLAHASQQTLVLQPQTQQLHKVASQLITEAQRWKTASECLDSQTSCSFSSRVPEGLLLVTKRGIFNAFAAPPSKTFNQRRLIGWSAEQMYTVVSQVEHYHKFVPWCQRSTVMKRSTDGSYMEAELEVGFQMLVERYTSKVTLRAPNMVRSTVSDSLLFHHLDSSWRMEPGPSPGTCWLTFDVDFAFNSVLYAHVADVFFNEVVKRMTNAFEDRCRQMYGPSSLLRLPQQQQGRPQQQAQQQRSHQHPGQHVQQQQQQQRQPLQQQAPQQRQQPAPQQQQQTPQPLRQPVHQPQHRQQQGVSQQVVAANLPKS